MRFFLAMLLIAANIILITALCVVLFCVFLVTTDKNMSEIILQNPLLFPFAVLTAALYSLKYSIPLSIVTIAACCFRRWLKKRR